jgi:hypothetical protein
VTKKRYKVIQWTTGMLGSTALKHIISNPRLQLVGLKCFGEDKEGQDAGQLLGLAPVGVTATRDEAALLELDADCVVFTAADKFMQDPTDEGSIAEEHLETVARILASGKNVVSSLAPPTHYKHFKDPERFISEISDACVTGNSSIHYTGIDPGFFSDALPLNIASAVGEVHRIETWEILNYGVIPVTHEESMKALGFGTPMNDESYEKKRRVVAQAWGGLPHLMTEATGVELDGTEITIDSVLADKTFTTAGGIEIPEGTVAGFHFAVKGIVAGEPVFICNHVTRMRETDAPQWPRIANSGGGGYRIEIRGSTDLTVDFPLGRPDQPGSAIAATYDIAASRLVNCIPPVVEAEPGYLTVTDLKTVVPLNVVPRRTSPGS